MIKGCSNHNCTVKGKTPGMHTNGICRCIGSIWKEGDLYITIDGHRVGENVASTCESYAIRKWLYKGLRDILALERKEQNDELVKLWKMVEDYQKWLQKAQNEIIKLTMEKKELVESFPIEAVRHISMCSCMCQWTGPEVESNAHLESCMVGRAQKYLGRKVTKIGLYNA